MGRVPPRQHWDEASGDRVRVLLECEAAATPWVVASVIERNGFEVRTCEGPASRRCDLLVHGACDLVDGADVVVNMLHATPESRSVVEEIGAARRPPAIVVEAPRRRWVPGGEAPAADGVGERVVTIDSPVTSAGLIAGINRALGRDADPSAG